MIAVGSTSRELHSNRQSFVVVRHDVILTSCLSSTWQQFRLVITTWWDFFQTWWQLHVIRDV